MTQHPDWWYQVMEGYQRRQTEAIERIADAMEKNNAE